MTNRLNLVSHKGAVSINTDLNDQKKILMNLTRRSPGWGHFDPGVQEAPQVSAEETHEETPQWQKAGESGSLLLNSTHINFLNFKKPTSVSCVGEKMPLWPLSVAHQFSRMEVSSQSVQKSPPTYRFKIFRRF